MISFAIIIGDDVGCVGVDDIITAKNSVTSIGIIQIMNTVHVKLPVSLEVAYVGRKKIVENSNENK